MGGLSIWHWLIVLVVVLVIFGTKRLTGGAKDLGSAVKEFKKGMRDDDRPAGELGDQSRRDLRDDLPPRDPRDAVPPRDTVAPERRDDDDRNAR